jgi:Protein of unknown function (DUF3126)
LPGLVLWSIELAITQEIPLKPDELAKLTKFFREKFNNSTMVAKARPQKKDSCELYVGDEFVGIIFRDEEDGELSYNFSMAILDIDLE